MLPLIIFTGFVLVGTVAIVTALRKEYTDNAQYWQCRQDYDKEEGMY